MRYALWIVQGLLALVFLFSGGVKFLMPAEEMTAGSPLPLHHGSSEGAPVPTSIPARWLTSFTDRTRGGDTAESEQLATLTRQIEDSGRPKQ